MNSVMIKNAQGQSIGVTPIRYFELNGIQYFIFSLNEVDEGGYVKLYISKVNGTIADTINDDIEWNSVKDIIKTIIKANKDNLPLPVRDLDESVLGSIQVMNQKVFKLNDSLLQLLGANKKVVASEVKTDDLELNFNDFGPQQPVQPEPLMPNAPESFVRPENNELPPIAPIMPEVNNFSQPTSFNTTPDFTETPDFTNLNTPVEPAVDYKSLYDQEVSKNAEISAENERLKNVLGQLKNTINQTF